MSARRKNAGSSRSPTKRSTNRTAGRRGGPQRRVSSCAACRRPTARRPRRRARPPGRGRSPCTAASARTAAPPAARPPPSSRSAAARSGCSARWANAPCGITVILPGSSPSSPVRGDRARASLWTTTASTRSSSRRCARRCPARRLARQHIVRGQHERHPARQQVDVELLATLSHWKWTTSAPRAQRRQSEHVGDVLQPPARDAPPAADRR